MLKDGENTKEKGSVYFLGKHKLKMTYSITLTQAIHYKLYNDLLYPKSCKLPTLVASDMPNKPLESYTFTIKRSPFHSGSYNFI